MWAPEAVCTFRRKEKSVFPAEIRTLDLSSRRLITISTELSQINFHIEIAVRQYFLWILQHQGREDKVAARRQLVERRRELWRPNVEV